MNFAVIKTGGKQYLVKPGQKLKVEKLAMKEGQKDFTFEQVLLLSDVQKGLQIGTPLVEEGKVGAKFLGQGKAQKVTTLKSKPKKRSKVKKGHRQPFTEVEIVKI